MWAIFVIHYGIKMYVTKVDNFGRICNFEKTKCSANNVPKFEYKDATKILDGNTFFKSYGVTNVVTGRQVFNSLKRKSIYGRNMW